MASSKELFWHDLRHILGASRGSLGGGGSLGLGLGGRSERGDVKSISEEQT